MLRTHTCGELNKTHVGQKVRLAGWVKKIRELGGLTFIDLVDRYGLVQLFFDKEKFSEEEYRLIKSLSGEDVIQVAEGEVRPRPEGNVNQNLSTGEIEVEVTRWNLLNRSKTPPFEIKNDIDISEELRLKYRFLDLRRPEMQNNIVFRHHVAQRVRQYFTRLDFVEVETPYLMKSTPEGARDFLVPSRMHPGKFYALPQSPQTYKQLLMVSGFDRYFQIVKCFRDEDLRRDRQPEFTQIDVEMSFIERDDILAAAEGLMRDLLKDFLNIDLPLPLEKISYETAMMTYGSDKPDRRFELHIRDVTSIFASSEFNVFKSLAMEGGFVGTIFVSGQLLSRKQIDVLTDLAKKHGAGGLAFSKLQKNSFDGGISKFFTESNREKLQELADSDSGTFLFLGTPHKYETLEILGAVRLAIAKEFDLIDSSKQDLFWVVDFPLFEYSKEEKRYVSRHHPFTAPKPEHLPLLDSHPEQVLSDAYDLVWNGNEIAGGSLRIYDKETQAKIFKLLGLGEDEAKLKFGFLMDAFSYGAPPHGGIAFGFDRLVMLMRGLESIRDVIPFPKTTSALSLMDGAPSEIGQEQLNELGLKINK
ncbi:MAG: aspartate--tRNA ligase [Calditrichia bacterium]